MEAASARAAARDQWDRLGQPTPSQLQRFIQAACSPENYEPNLALDLEIADLINTKKGSAPREASVAIVNFINHRNPNVAMLALTLLDICVKNCGYPFHLQISTKEFLNELVRRFPERPAIRPNRVQAKILELIEEWRGTICETSRYKEDLGFIRDMHRLLSYKGYVFPEVRREDAAVLNPSDNLKSAEEMEEEEREAQSAKLQELVRRGTPADLQEANRLMKIMAGYDTRSKVDYRAKAAEDVSKIQEKARLLEERLAAFQQGDKMTDNDVYSEMVASLQSAHPKIQKMCQEESDDHEAVAKLLEINDSIHRTIERYRLLKRGDHEGAAKLAAGAPIPSSSNPTPSGAANTSAANELSLIDFDTEVGTSNGKAPESTSGGQQTGVENDLLGLSIGESENFGQSGAIGLGFGANQNIPGPALLSSMTDSSTATGAAPPQPSSSFSPTGFVTTPSLSKSNTPQPASAFSPPSQSNQAVGASADPFAGLGSSNGSLAAAQPPAAPKPQTSNDEDEWSFSSALPTPPPTHPREHRAVVSSTSVKIDMAATRPTPTTNAIHMLFVFSNNTAQPVSDLHFQLAVTKGYELKLNPQTGQTLLPKQSRGVTQSIEVWHAGNQTQKVESIKLRWRVAYTVGGEAKQEMGEIPEFSLA